MDRKKPRMRIDMWYPTDCVESENIYLFESPEISAYWHTLCRKQWLKKGALPNDDAKLARLLAIGKDKWLKVRPVLEPYFVITDSDWYSQFIAEELERSLGISMERTVVAKRRWIREKLLNITGGEVIPDMDAIVLDIAKQSVDTGMDSGGEDFAIKQALRARKVAV